VTRDVLHFPMRNLNGALLHFQTWNLFVQEYYLFFSVEVLQESNFSSFTSSVKLEAAFLHFPTCVLDVQRLWRTLQLYASSFATMLREHVCDVDHSFAQIEAFISCSEAGLKFLFQNGNVNSMLVQIVF
jgi:hypothetical protein